MRAVYIDQIEVGDTILIDNGSHSTDRFGSLIVSSIDLDEGCVVCNYIDVYPDINDQYIVIDP